MSPTPARSSDSREVLRDLATGALSLALAGALTIAHFGQTGRLHEDYGREPGPALLPELLLGALALAGAGMLARGLFGYWRDRPWLAEGELRSGMTALATPVLVVTLLVVFLIVQRVIGFGLSCAGIGMAVAMILARQDRKPLPRAALEGILIAVALYGLFRFVLSVPLT